MAVENALGRIDDGASAMLDRVVAWSAVNSGSYEVAGLRRMADLLEPALATLPGRVDRIPLAETHRISPHGQPVPVEHGPALLLQVRPAAPLQIALTGHYDTVFPAASAFQSASRLDDGRLNGPGVADMKGGIAVMLEALAAFETTPEAQAVGYQVLLSPDEEIGSPASAPLLERLGRACRLGMTYEPALPDGTVVDARSGSGNFTVVVRGRAAHVGRAFEEGRNAVLAAAALALRLEALNGRRDGVKLNVGAIDGGGPVNMVPATAVLRFNVRAPDAEAAGWASAQIEAAVAGDEAPPDGLSFALQGGFTRPPKPVTPRQRALLGWVAAAGRDLGLAMRFAPSGGVCEGNNLFAAGCPNVDTLGPRGGALHSADEYAWPDSFAERAKLSLLLLHGVASGRFDMRALAP